MKKRIVVLSTVASHPQNAGHRARIYYLLQTLKDWGHQVYFVYLKGKYQQACQGNIKAMVQHWGEDYFSCPNFLELANLNPKRIVRDEPDSPIWNLDDWFDDSLGDYLQELDKKIQPNIVISEYAVLSKALEYFSPNVLRVLDTLDAFSNRNVLLSDHGIYNDSPVPSFCPEDESKAFSRADIVIAIQKNEQRYFESLTEKSVVCIGHLAPVMAAREDFPLAPQPMYIGSAGKINQKNLSRFLSDILPRVKKRGYDGKLLVIGDICSHVPALFDDVIKKPFVEELSSVYERATLGVNADVFATGLSIKSITTLSFATPLVTTSIGARGLEEGGGNAFLIADEPEEFADCMHEVLSCRQLQLQLSRSAHEFMTSYRQDSLNVLRTVVENN